MLRARLYEHEMQRKEEENPKELNTKTEKAGAIKLDHTFYNLIS